MKRESKMTNTDNSLVTVTGADGSWSAIDSSKTQAWIEGTVDPSSLNTTDASIVFGSSGTFNFYGGYWTDTGPTTDNGATMPAQTLWRKPITTIDWSTSARGNQPRRRRSAHLQLFSSR